MKFSDKISYLYIKRIKRWIECPVCHEKMLFEKDIKEWKCKSCLYSLLEKEFLDDYIFWFCDKCGVYLNNQKKFDRKLQIHKCEKCGFKNKITFDNIKGQCIKCGGMLDNPKSNICYECLKNVKEIVDDLNYEVENLRKKFGNEDDDIK